MALGKLWGRSILICVSIAYGVLVVLNMVTIVSMASFRAQRLRFTSLAQRGGAQVQRPAIGSLGLLRHGCPLLSTGNVSILGATLQVPCQMTP